MSKNKSVLNNQSLADNYEGEAKFVRALCYYTLLNIYCRPYADGNGSKLGVILRLTPAVDATGNDVARSTVEECYVQIIKDLKLVFPSFAALNLNDDSSKNFFDILPSESVSIISPKSISVFREKSLKNVGDEIISGPYGAVSKILKDGKKIKVVDKDQLFSEKK